MRSNATDFMMFFEFDEQSMFNLSSYVQVKRIDYYSINLALNIQTETLIKKRTIHVNKVFKFENN